MIKVSKGKTPLNRIKKSGREMHSCQETRQRDTAKDLATLIYSRNPQASVVHTVRDKGFSIATQLLLAFWKLLLCLKTDTCVVLYPLERLYLI
jgi:hypothetical protein